jgi:hypothetical protein
MFITGMASSFLSFNNVLGIIITVALITIPLAIIPFVNEGAIGLKWILSLVLLAGLFFGISIPVSVYTLNIGIGLASNMMALFPSNPFDVASSGYFLFLGVGIIGFIDGLISVESSGN